jgi:hypothetical protein
MSGSCSDLKSFWEDFYQAARFELQEIDDRQYERLFPTEGEGD